MRLFKQANCFRMKKTCIGLDCEVTNYKGGNDQDEKLYCRVEFYSHSPAGPLVVVVDKISGEMMAVPPVTVRITDSKFRG